MAYSFSGIGKISGPAGLALIIGSFNFITPQAMLPAVLLAFVYLACRRALAGLVYGLIGIETKGRSFAEIDGMLRAEPAVKAEPVAQW